MQNHCSKAIQLFALGAAIGLLGKLSAKADAVLTVDAAHPSHAISPMLYGLMTEEINQSYDGGLYAELIQNRSFKDDPNTPAHWSLSQTNGSSGEMTLDRADPLNAAQDVSLKLTASSASGNQPVGVANDGFWGIPVKPLTTYRASFYAKANSNFSGPLIVSLETADGRIVWAKAQVTRVTRDWTESSVTLKTDASAKPSSANRFVISMASPGSVWLSLVSLFPPTYNNRPNGNRIDLMEKMAAMHPSFLRFPGGNFVEGDSFAVHYDWKKTIGDIAQRPGQPLVLSHQ